MIDKIKDLILIIPAVITFLAFTIKFVKNFFFNSIKTRYRRNIGKMSNFEAAITLIVTMVIYLEILLASFILAFIICSNVI